MILVDDISAYHYMIRDGIPIYSDGEPAYLESLSDTSASGSKTALPESMLFDFGQGPLHLLVTDPHRRSDQGNCRYRVRTGELPPKSFVRLTEDVCIASPQLWFVEVGLKVPLVRQIEIGEELIGRYSLSLDENERIVKRAEPLVTLEELRAYVESCAGTLGARQARIAVKYLTGISESPMETRAEMSMSLPFKYGGLRIPRPVLNRAILLPERLWDIAGRRSFRLDISWPGSNFEIEYRGKGSHPDTPEKNDEDTIRDTIINYLGIDSIEITERQVKNRRQLGLLAMTAEKRLGTRHYSPPPGFVEKQGELFGELYDWRIRRKRLAQLWE